MANKNKSPESGEEHVGEEKGAAEVQTAERPSKDARTWAMFCHLAGLAGIVIPVVGNIVGPLILWQLKKEEFPFVDEQGKEAVNFQITMTICAVVAMILFVVCVGPFLLAAVGIVDLVLLLVAAVKANDGKSYRYPLSIRLIK